MLVGAYAVGCDGYPRATAELDIWISRTEAKARKVAAVLGEFGFTGAAPPGCRLDPGRADLARTRGLECSSSPSRGDSPCTRAGGIDS